MKASEYVKQFTDPIYQWFYDYGSLIIILVAAIVFIRLGAYIIKRSDAARWRRAEYGNTNTWFSIKEESSDETCKNSEPQNN